MMASDKRRQSPEYWEARLKRMNLEMGRGHVNWIDYGHDIKHLDTDGRRTYVSVTGEREDLAEWPISML